MENPISLANSETTPDTLSPLDTWILRNAEIIRSLIEKKHGNVLQVRKTATAETGGQSHVRISSAGITHQLTGQAFRTKDQLNELLGINISAPAV